MLFLNIFRIINIWKREFYFYCCCIYTNIFNLFKIEFSHSTNGTLLRDGVILDSLEIVIELIWFPF